MRIAMRNLRAIFLLLCGAVAIAPETLVPAQDSPDGEKAPRGKPALIGGRLAHPFADKIAKRLHEAKIE